MKIYINKVILDALLEELQEGQSFTVNGPHGYSSVVKLAKGYAFYWDDLRSDLSKSEIIEEYFSPELSIGDTENVFYLEK